MIHVCCIWSRASSCKKISKALTLATSHRRHRIEYPLILPYLTLSSIGWPLRRLSLLRFHVLEGPDELATA